MGKQKLCTNCLHCEDLCADGVDRPWLDVTDRYLCDLFREPVDGSKRECWMLRINEECGPEGKHYIGRASREHEALYSDPETRVMYSDKEYAANLQRLRDAVQ